MTLLPAPEQIKFSFQLTPEERAAEQKRYLRLIAQARTAAREIPDGLLVLDEVCAAVNTGLLPLEEVLSCLDAAACEVVLTGRDPAPELLARADYVTEMKKLRHPYDPIRPGDGRPPGGGVVVPPFGGCPSCRKK